MLTLLLSNDFILFWHFHKKICLKTFFEDKHFDPVNAFGPNTFQPCYRVIVALVLPLFIAKSFLRFNDLLDMARINLNVCFY